MATKELSVGFWYVAAKIFILHEQHKPFFGFFGSPYLRFSQCCGLWGYIFQLGGVLGTKYAAKNKTDAFVSAFLGKTSEKPGDVMRALAEQADGMLAEFSLTTMNGAEYIEAYVSDRTGVKGSAPGTLFAEFGTHKIRSKEALARSYEFAEAGAALGITNPSVVRGIFERTNAPVPREDWQQVAAAGTAAGLDIGPEQTPVTYEEFEESENAKFMDFCQKLMPDLYPLLKD